MGSQGVVARVLECGMFPLSTKSIYPDGLPHECAKFAPSVHASFQNMTINPEVTVTSSRDKFVAASFLRHDLPFRLVTGLRMGLLLRPSLERGVASPTDIFCEDCSLIPHCDPNQKPSERAQLMKHAFRNACEGLTDPVAIKRAFLASHRCINRDWERAMETQRLLFQLGLKEPSMCEIGPLVHGSWPWCEANQVSVRYKTRDVAAIFVTSHMLDAYTEVVRAIQASIRSALRRQVPVVLLEQTEKIKEACLLSGPMATLVDL